MAKKEERAAWRYAGTHATEEAGTINTERRGAKRGAS